MLSALAMGVVDDAIEHTSDLFRLVFGIQYPMFGAMWHNLDLNKKDCWIKDFELCVAMGLLRGQPCSLPFSHVSNLSSVKHPANRCTRSDIKPPCYFNYGSHITTVDSLLARLDSCSVALLD